jgi:hypothetical protein
LPDPGRLIKLNPLNPAEGHSMQTCNIHEARTRLSRIVDQATRGEPFIIARAGRVKTSNQQTPEQIK